MTEQITALQKIMETLVTFLVNYSFQVLGAVIILIVGAFVARGAANMVLKLCEKNKFDIVLSKFLASVAKILVLVFAGIIAMGNFGITITPFIAALGAVAFGATYALQGPLSNYCAGLSIIMSRPFTIGDTVTIAGQGGVVQEVKLACTVLTNEDGVRITIPNKDIVGEVLHNSRKNHVVEAEIGIAYSASPEEAIRLIRDVLNTVPEITKNPQPQIGIKSFGDSSINIAYRYWVPTEKYYQISFTINLSVFNAFKRAGISIPFPQREVRILSETANASLKH